jgi:hypothetical protein
MTLHYRLHRSEDEPQLLALWSEHSGWGAIDAEAWAHRLMHPPFGPASIIVGEDPADGKILAQFAFIPVLVQVGDREVIGTRPFAPIVSPERQARGRSLNPASHPALQMFLAGTDLLRARGDGLMYILPDPRWARVLRPFPFIRTATFPLFSRRVPATALPPLPSGFTAEPITPHGAEVDALWARTRSSAPTMLVRDSRMLSWKIGSGDHTVLGIRAGGDLCALVAAKHKGDRQWLIGDLLATDDSSRRAALIAACHAGDAAAREQTEGVPIAKLAILATPALQPLVESLGFARDDYTFTLAVRQLDDTLQKERLAPASWYVSATD